MGPARPTSSSTNPHQVEVFRTLLADLDIDQRYADLLVDWIDTDIAPQATQGGEDTLYLTQVPPYRPPNTFITHPSELLALPGFGARELSQDRAFRHGAALRREGQSLHGQRPGARRHHATIRRTRTNSSGMDLAALREKGCFPTEHVFTGVIGDPQPEERWSRPASRRNRRWFRLRTNIRIGTAEFVLYSVLYPRARPTESAPCSAVLEVNDR